MLANNIYQDVLHPRRATLNYISPAICEASFSGSSFATLVLEALERNRLTQITGYRFSNFDETTNTYTVEWNVYPDALCYNIYTANNPGDPNTTYTLVAECVSDPNYDPNNPTGGPGGGGGTPGTPGNPTTPGNPGIPGGGVVTPGVPGTPGTPGGGIIVTAVTPTGETPFPPSFPPLTPPPPAPPAPVFYSAAYTANCPEGFTGTPITKPYGAYTSTINQSTADFLAINAANSELVCTPIGGTVCDLNTAGTGDQGSVSLPNVAGTTTLDFGTFPEGNYTITYIGGCHSDEDNPCPIPPNNVKFASVNAIYNNGATTIDWLDGAGSVCADNETDCANAVKAIRETLEFDHSGGTISMSIGRFGAPTNPGGSDPVFQLEQNCIYPTLPEQVRIAGYNAADFATCPGQPASATDPWDGTFEVQFTNNDCSVLGQTYLYDASSFFDSINGQEISLCEVYFIADGSAPTTTGCGWALVIALDSADLWLGYKDEGTSPVGVYTRASGCSATPATLTVEEY